MTTKPADHCDVLLEKLSAYLDGDLSAPGCRAIERHAGNCPRCTAVLNELRRTVGICHDAAATPLPDAVRQRARARVRQIMRDRA